MFQICGHKFATQLVSITLYLYIYHFLGVLWESISELHYNSSICLGRRLLREREREREEKVGLDLSSNCIEVFNYTASIQWNIMVAFKHFYLVLMTLGRSYDITLREK